MDGSQQSATEAGYLGLVRGPSAIFPRGGTWTFGLGYVVACLGLILLVKDPLSVNLAYVVGLGSAAATVIMLFRNAKVPAFAADEGGIWLGRKNTARAVRLQWEQIRQLEVTSDPHGSTLQILLGSGVRPTGIGRQLGSLALLYVWWLGISRATPELLTVLPDPPRYRVPLAQVTPQELRTALAALVPATVPIEVRL